MARSRRCASLLLLAGLFSSWIPFAAARADTAPATEQGLCASGSCATEQQCATAMPISLHGSLLGSDGRFINATLGLTLKSATGKVLDAHGCAFSHDSPAILLNPNFAVPAEGSTTVGGATWSVTDIPGNATWVQIETYPRSAASDPRYVTTTLTYYGRAERHFPLNAQTIAQDVTVREPRVGDCTEPNAAGSAWLAAGRVTDVHTSSTGKVTTFDLVRLTLRSADAFSALKDRNDPGTGSPILGLSIGQKANGFAQALGAMASAPGKGEPYSVVFRASGGGHSYAGTATPADAAGHQTFGIHPCTETYGAMFVVPSSLTRRQQVQVEDTITHLAHMQSFYAHPKITLKAISGGLTSADNTRLSALFLRHS